MRALFIGVLLLFSGSLALAENGTFGEGPHVLLSPDGYKMKLTKDFSYTDLNGEAWTTPADTVVNGASIPRGFWSYIGGPLSGKFRNASIIHDHYCVIKDRPHELVHNNFHEAMLQSGVRESKAWVMYQAVARFGPKWDMEELAACREENPDNLAVCVENTGHTMTIDSPSAAAIDLFLSDMVEAGYSDEVDELRSAVE